MQQRLEGLQAALATCSKSSDEDDWSDTSGDSHAKDTHHPKTLVSAPARELVETERERHIRMGLITPFDKVAGVARQVHRDAPVSVLTPAPLLAPSSHGAKLSATAKRLVQRRRAQEKSRPAVQEMAPEDLDEDMLQFVRKQEYFNRRKSNSEAKQATEAAKAARFKRKQTLPQSRGTLQPKRQKDEMIGRVRKRRKERSTERQRSGSSEGSPAAGKVSDGVVETSGGGEGGALGAGLEDDVSRDASEMSLSSSDDGVDATGFDDAGEDHCPSSGRPASTACCV
jgi:DNA excision repair protein ERCC-6